MMGSGAGEFPYTVTLHAPNASTTNSLGQLVRSWDPAGSRCAARVWTVSRDALTRDAAEMQVRGGRLLLREPRRDVKSGWLIVWKGSLYEVGNTEERDFDLLIDLKPASTEAPPIDTGLWYDAGVWDDSQQWSDA